MIKTNNEVRTTDFENYLNLEHLQEKLEELRNKDLSNLSKEEIGKEFYNYLNFIPSLTVNYSVDQFNNSLFYRVRLSKSIGDKEDFNLIQTYSYPPAQFCDKIGRANLKFKSVFYSSNCPLTAIKEAKPEVGDIGYLSVWEGNTLREMKAGALIPKNLKSENVWHGLSDGVYNYAENYINKEKIEKAQFYHEALKFISQLFLDGEKSYLLTSWIANELFYESAWRDFIIYPSFYNNAYSCNIALHPNVVNNYLKFKKVIKFKIKDINKKIFSIGKVGQIVNNNILWREPSKEESDFPALPLDRIVNML